MVNILHKIISLNDAFNLDNVQYIDVRSPSEFAVGSLPGAVNVPLLDDAERAQVGILYKTVGPEQAKQRGLEVVSVKLPAIVNTIRDLCKPGQTSIIFCWRGGMRSKAIVTILELMGISVFQLVGGYKEYRRYVLDSLTMFNLRPPVFVLCGLTGVGKTAILDRLEQRGIPVINLEKLANHRGSAFGHVGLGRPATAQSFDAALLSELQKLQDAPYIIVECESKRVGNVYLPDVLYDAMQKGKEILVYADIEARITRLIGEYASFFEHNKEELKTSIQSLKKRLGNTKTNMLVHNLEAGQLQAVVRVLLEEYYDPLYRYDSTDSDRFDFIVNANDLEWASAQIADYLHQFGRR